jgi:hypothetical protein
VTAPNVDQDPGQVGQLSPTVLDHLDGQLATRRAEREAERKRAAARGGPCSRCGATESWERPGVGGWAGGDQHGAICHSCDGERGGPAGDDREHRARAARLVLGQTSAPPWAGHGSEPAVRYWLDGYLADAFVWFYEAGPGARPGRGAERFAYVTAEHLRDRLYQGREPRPPVLRSRGRRHRCEGCGCKGECWTVQQVGVAAQVHDDGRLSSVARSHFRVTWTCHTCQHQDVEQRPDQLPGVPVAGLVG